MVWMMVTSYKLGGKSWEGWLLELGNAGRKCFGWSMVWIGYNRDDGAWCYGSYCFGWVYGCVQRFWFFAILAKSDQEVMPYGEDSEFQGGHFSDDAE
jgi:hypothetical protein